MNTSDILSIVAIGLSALTIIWNIISYFRFDRPLKKLDIKSKQIEILKYEQEQENKLKAMVKGRFEYIGDGKYYHLLVYNAGECAAKNLNIIIPDKTFYLPSPIKTTAILPPGEKFVIRVDPNNNCPQNVNIGFTWDDDFAANRSINEIVFIPNRF